MPRYTKPRRTWHYLNEFKVKAVQLSLLEDVQVKDVATTLDIHPFMLSRWRKEYREGKLVADKRQKITSMAKDKKDLTKIKQLEKENASLRQENDLLKKWQRFLAEEHQNDLDSLKDTDKTSE
jgi:transposase